MLADIIFGGGGNILSMATFLSIVAKVTPIIGMLEKYIIVLHGREGICRKNVIVEVASINADKNEFCDISSHNPRGTFCCDEGVKIA